MDIFISYSRRDRDRVNFMAKALEAEGYSVWWDRDLRAGEEFDNVIDKHIKQSKVIVVVWSETSINSNWVKEEAEDGVLDNKLVPALIDEVIIPRGFRRIQAAELQDSSANPTQSKNWSVFLDSIRTIAGEGQGAKAGAEEMAEFGITQTPASKLSPTPATEPSAPIMKRPIGKITAGFAALTAIVLAGFFLLQLVRPGGPPPPEDMTPVVLGIYPNELFGDDQRVGVTSALSGSDIDVIHLTDTLDAMKGRDTPELIAALEENLKKRNVIAIVGPSITELTPQVLDTVKESGRKPAIILTTAAPRRVIGWDDRDLPLFRVGSGVDERAKQFAHLARNTIESGTELVVFYESVPMSSEKTYGEEFFDGIKRQLPEWNTWTREGRVHDIQYLRGQIMQSISREEQRQHFYEKKMIVVVGLSMDYVELVVNLYRADVEPTAALLGGWNTSQNLQLLGRELDLQHTMLFEMTDVVASPAEVRSRYDARRFERDFGELDPAKRQAAVAYDSALVIAQAAKIAREQADGAPIDSDDIVKLLKDRTFMGITGEIEFGDDGQNAGNAGGRSLYNLTYDPTSEEWSPIERFDTMLARELAAR